MRRTGHPLSFAEINGQILEYEDVNKGLSLFGTIEENDARELFCKLKELFDEAGIQFVLIYGSLLGAVRSGTIIPGDTDMDVYVQDEEKLRANILSFYDEGLKICRVMPGKLYSFEINTECYIDVYIFRELTGIQKFLWGRSCIAIMGQVTPRRFFDGYSYIEFLGEKVLCPKDSIGLLEFFYGSDWRIPQDKKGIYEIRSLHCMHKPGTLVIKMFQVIFKILRLIFSKTYRNDILLRKKKTGSYFYKNSVKNKHT